MRFSCFSLHNDNDTIGITLFLLQNVMALLLQKTIKKRAVVTENREKNRNFAP